MAQVEDIMAERRIAVEAIVVVIEEIWIVGIKEA